MRPHGRFAHCSCKNAVPTLDLGTIGLSRGFMLHFHTCSFVIVDGSHQQIFSAQNICCSVILACRWFLYTTRNITLKNSWYNDTTKRWVSLFAKESESKKVDNNLPFYLYNPPEQYKPLYSFENGDPSTITKRGICGALMKERHEKNRGSKQQRSISRTPPASETNTELSKWLLPARQWAWP